MRRVLLLLSLFALAGCKEEIPQGGVKVTVKYEGFRPRCVRVMARDVSGGQEPLSTDVEGEKVKGEATGGSIVVGVLPPDNWGSDLEVEARAFERACTGEPVVKRSQSVTMIRGESTATTLQLTTTDTDMDGYASTRSGGTDCNDDRPDINPGVTEELCNGVDDNCNGQSDTAELQLGQECTEGASCKGTRACGDTGQVVCNVPAATMAYPDVDRDGHGDKNATATAFCDGVPVGFVTGPNDDCDDSATGANVFPGAFEYCDGKNNDCDAETDEGYPQLNEACTDLVTKCGGTNQCTAQGTAVTCVVSQQVPTWYPDDDGDGYGRSAEGQETCVQPAGAFVNQGDDCDDGNRFTHRDARELCDGLDNDCDAMVETAAACPAGGPVWAERTVGTSSQEWRSVFSVVPGGVGIVGGNNARASLAPGSNTFQISTSGCATSSTGWNTLWVDEASDGRGYFGSSGGRLVYQDRTNPNCNQPLDISRDVRGLVGLRNGGSLEIHGVTAALNNADGSTFIWDGNTTRTDGTTRVSSLYDIHGVSRAALFAVGGYDSSSLNAGPRIYRFNVASGQWMTENVQSIPGLARLNGVWVVNEKVAFAVGDLNSVLQWNGLTWRKLAFPSTNIESLSSIIAFGANSAYATANNGRIYRYNGQQWQMIFEDTSLRFTDIAGTSPADLWVVGTNGVVLHWPQWPQ